MWAYQGSGFPACSSRSCSVMYPVYDLFLEISTEIAHTVCMKIGYDTDLFKFFAADEEVKELERYKFTASTETFTRQSGYGYGYGYGGTQIKDVLLIDWKDENGDWKRISKIDPYMIDSYYLKHDNAYYAERLAEAGLTPEHVTGVREAIEGEFARMRREHNREVAAERKKKNEAEAKAKGVSVEDLLFERKKKRMAKSVDKTTAEMKVQMKLNFEYSKELEKLETEIARCRRILESHEIHRLKLRNNPWNVTERVRKCINTLQGHIQQHEEEKK